MSTESASPMCSLESLSRRSQGRCSSLSTTSKSLDPGDELGALIGGLLASESSRLRFVLASRRDIPFDLSIYEERGELMALRAPEPFTRRELAEFLELATGAPAHRRLVRELWEQTRGWPALVSMLAPTEASQPPQPCLSEPIRRFVVEELLGALEPQERYVLKAISILDAVRVESARALLSEPVNGRQVRGPVSRFISIPEAQVRRHLEALTRGQFVLPVAKSPRGRALNPAIQSVLSHLFEAEDPRAYRLAHHRVAEHYLEEGAERGLETISHLLQAGDFERAMEMLEEHADLMRSRGMQTDLSRSLKSLERHFSSLPLWAAYHLGCCYSDEGELERAKGYFEQCLAGLKSWDEAGLLWRWQPRVCLGFATLSWRRGMGDQARTYCQRGLAFMNQLWRRGAIAQADTLEAQELQLSLLTLIATLKLERGVYDKAEGFAREAVELARQAGAKRAEAVAMRQIGAVASYRGELLAARQHLCGALALLDPDEDQSTVALVSFDLGRLMRREGQAAEGRKRMEEALTPAVEHAHPSICSRLFGMVGEAYGEDGEPDAAALAFKLALEHASEVADPKVRVEVLHRFVVCLAKHGAVDDAKVLLRRASELLSGQFRTQVQLNAQHYEARAEYAAASAAHGKVHALFNQAVERARCVGAHYHVVRLSFRAAECLHEAFVHASLEDPEAVFQSMEQGFSAGLKERGPLLSLAPLELLHVGAMFAEEALRERSKALLKEHGVPCKSVGAPSLSEEVIARYRAYRRRIELEDDFLLVRREGQRGANARDVERALADAGQRLILRKDEQALYHAGKRTDLSEKRVILPLLRFFLLHPGEAFSMAHLSRQVWGKGDDKGAMQTKVKVAVSRLRSLLGKERVYIETTRIVEDEDGASVVAYGLADGFDYLLVERVEQALDG